MKRILVEILKEKKQYATLPFFSFLRDERLTPRQRIAFYPHMAYFILAFGDLNALVLRRDSDGDPLQDLVNAHTREDDHHWAWYLEDYRKLGFDRLVSSEKLLKQLFSRATVANRQLMYSLTGLIANAESVQRLVIIEAIEETGQVLFSLLLPIANALEEEIGQELRYIGKHHFELETGHAMNGDHRQLAEIELTTPQFETARLHVRAVFSSFARWTQELLESTQRPALDVTLAPFRRSGSLLAAVDAK
jgi:hypothetical protein